MNAKLFRRLLADMRSKRTLTNRRAMPLRCESLEKRRLMTSDLTGGSVVVDENFDDGNAGEFASVYSNASSAEVVLESVQDAQGNGAAVNGFFETTFDTDESQTLLLGTLNDANSVEVSFDFRFPDGIPVEDISRNYGSVKLSRLVAPDSAPRYHSMQNHLQFYGNNDGSITYELGWYVEQGDFADNIAIELDPTAWTNIRYRATFNTPGQADGEWTVWLNGEKVVDRQDVVWADQAAFRPDSFWVGGNISFGGEDPSRPFRRQLDNVQVTVDGEPQDPPAPESPRGTRVEERFGSSVLVIEALEESSRIRIDANADGAVQVRENGVDAFFARVDSVELLTGDGDDQVRIDSELPVVAHTGGGNDSIHVEAALAMGDSVFVDAGDGDDFVLSRGSTGVLLGGSGDDTLIATGGSQILIGQQGRDRLLSLATTQPHILVGGETDANPELLTTLSTSLDEFSDGQDTLVQLLNPIEDSERDYLLALGASPAIVLSGEWDFTYQRRRRLR